MKPAAQALRGPDAATGDSSVVRARKTVRHCVVGHAAAWANGALSVAH